MTTNVAPALVDGILFGNILAQVVPAMSVRTVGLVALRNQLQEPIADQSLAIGAAPAAGLLRCDLVQWNGTTINVKAGTAAAIAAVNAPTPDPGFIPLALILVFNGDTTIRNMGTLDSSSTSKGRILAYYYSRRGLYAATQSAQDVAAASPDPEIVLPIFHPRTGTVRVKFNGCANQAPSGFNGLQATILLDGALIGRSQARQQYNQGPVGSPEAQNSVEAISEMPRAGVPSGVHRWAPSLQFRDAAGQVLTYRFMEVEEIF